jgi:Uma2 family endonuclease
VIRSWEYKRKWRMREEPGILYFIFVREDANQVMIRRLGDQVQKLQEILNSEKKSRENAQN